MRDDSAILITFQTPTLALITFSIAGQFVLVR
jgi:hypothetical protein